MENLYLVEINEIMHHIILTPGITIQGLYGKTTIPVEVTRNLLLYIAQFPMGGIRVYCEGYPPDYDLLQLDDDILDTCVRWTAQITGMEKVPVENMTEEESFALASLIHVFYHEKGLNIEKALKIDFEGNFIYTKGIRKNTDTLFKLAIFPVIRKALFNRHSIRFTLSGETGSDNVQGDPLGIVYHSEQEKWYMIVGVAGGAIKPFNLEQVVSVTAGEPFAYPRDFSMKNYLKTFFALETDEGADVEIVFKNEGNVVKKARRRLEAKGVLRDEADGSLSFEGKLVGLEELKRWLLGFGSSVVVRKPVWLRDEILKEQEGIILNYQNVEYFEELVRKP